MPLLISDELLSETGLSEREATIEIACRLFAAGHLTMPAATRWTSLSRGEFEQALLDRQLPLIVADKAYWSQEQQTLDARQTP